MDYKLVCIDMDGTLLNTQHKVSDASKEALRKAHSKGVHIVVSTGRMYVDAEYFSNLIGVKSPVIASNGAFIKEKDRSEVIYKNVLGENLSHELLNIFLKYNVQPIFYTPEISYGGSIYFKIFMQYLKLKGITNRNIKLKHVYSLKQWNEVLKFEKGNIVKCEVLDKDEQKLRKIRAEIMKIDNIEVVSSSIHNIEVNSKGVSKGRAVEVLAGYYNIDRKNIIAIGDSENDLSMIEYAGMGIAMGNAIDAVKHKANYVTDTNANDGVAKAIQRFILNVN